MGESQKIILTLEQTAELQRLYEEGKGSGWLAKHFGISAPTVRRLLREAGTAIRSLRRLTDEQRRLVANYYRAWSLEELEAEFGCGYKALRNALTEHGVETRKNGVVAVPVKPDTETTGDYKEGYREGYCNGYAKALWALRPPNGEGDGRWRDKWERAHNHHTVLVRWEEQAVDDVPPKMVGRREGI